MDIFGCDIPLWCIILIIALGLFYWYSTSTFGIFKQIGVPGPKPLPVVGNMHTMMKNVDDFFMECSKKYGNIFGVFQGRTPVLVTCDPEVIKQVMVKDFAYFRNRDPVRLDINPLNKMVATLREEQWKNVRNHVSPTFSGLKLRTIMAQINRCSKTLVNNLKVSAEAGDMFEAKEYAGSFTMDVNASTLFSIDVDSQNDKNNKFVRMARKCFDVNSRLFAIMVVVLFPFLLNHLHKIGLSLFPKDPLKFFVEIVERAIKDRQEHPEESPKDFLQMILLSQVKEVQKENLQKDKVEDAAVNGLGATSRTGLTHAEIVGQCFVFFIAGYDTIATLLSLTLYSLAVNRHCQGKAYQEIQDIIGQNDPTYDDMKKMSYIEMCLEETLRLYPPALFVNRKCAVERTISGVRVPKGIQVSVPIITLHRNPEVWPDPEKYDPKRFTAEAKSSRHEFQYMPFGMGPRACVAKRLVLLEAKAAIVHMVRNFRFVTCEKTQIPLKLKKLKMEAENGVWLKVETRT